MPRPASDRLTRRSSFSSRAPPARCCATPMEPSRWGTGTRPDPAARRRLHPGSPAGGSRRGAASRGVRRHRHHPSRGRHPQAGLRSDPARARSDRIPARRLRQPTARRHAPPVRLGLARRATSRERRSSHGRSRPCGGRAESRSYRSRWCARARALICADTSRSTAARRSKRSKPGTDGRPSAST